MTETLLLFSILAVLSYLLYVMGDYEPKPKPMKTRLLKKARAQMIPTPRGLGYTIYHKKIKRTYSYDTLEMFKTYHRNYTLRYAYELNQKRFLI